jgi:hypothetical protein
MLNSSSPNISPGVVGAVIPMRFGGSPLGLVFHFCSFPNVGL